jgi:hypothetical protein
MEGDPFNKLEDQSDQPDRVDGAMARGAAAGQLSYAPAQVRPKAFFGECGVCGAKMRDGEKSPLIQPAGF